MFRFFSVVAVAGAVALSAGSVCAQARDDAATKLADEALLNEYLAMDFQGAIKKLEKALAICEGGKCSPKVLARIHRDLGVVYLAGLNDAATGQAEFAAALSADPNVALDPDLSTDAVVQAFNEAKAGGPAAGGAQGGGEIGAIAGVGTEELAADVPTSGTLLHVPPPEQTLSTPLPLYLELVSGIEVDKILVHYLPPTMRDWVTLPMPERGLGYGVVIECGRVGGTPGNLQYYIEAYQGGTVVGFSGSQDIPHRVAIKSALDGERPSLPGEEPPAPCETVADDCPPGFPGCGEDVGGECQVDDDCSVGLVCREEKCAKPQKKVKVRHSWLTAAFQVDVMMMKKSSQVCSGSNYFTCFFAGDAEYLGSPDPNNGNAIQSGGFAAGTMRVLLGYEYLLNFGLGVGLRGGFAFGGQPKSRDHTFLPVHAEVRFAYYGKPSARVVQPYALLAAGMAEVNAKKSVSLTQSMDQCLLPPEDGGVLIAGACPDPPESQQDRFMGTPLPAFSEPTRVDAWNRAGNGFVALGGGMRFVMKNRFGPFVELRAGYAFPAASMIAAGQGGVVLGF